MLVEFFIIIVGRYIAIFTSYYLFACCDKSINNQLSLRQLTFTAFAALIRGAIAFGLVAQIGDELEEREVIVSSTLALVIVSTVLWGGITACT